MNDYSNKPTGREIQTAFFRAYEFGGVFHSCIDWMRERYDLGYKASHKDEQETKEELPGRWRHYYDVELPQIIADAMAVFDSSVIEGLESPLINEIATVLDELTGKPRERYIYSLLKPFKELSDIFHPEAKLKRLRGEIEKYKHSLAYWEACNPNEHLYNVNGEPSGTSKEQGEACRQMIALYESQIKRVNELNNRYFEILNDADLHSKLRVETNLCILFDKACLFADRLDALFLERGVNLLWYQQESGIYLKKHREITDVSYYIGSDELAAKYIAEAQPKIIKPQQDTNRSREMPREQPTQAELTDRVKYYFSKAVERGWMKQTDTGYKWLFNSGSKATLAYFLIRVFCPNNTEKLPESALNKLFGVSRLGSASDQVFQAKKPQKWRETIDCLFV